MHTLTEIKDQVGEGPRAVKNAAVGRAVPGAGGSGNDRRPD